MSNLIIIPKKNGYLVRNQNNNKEMAVFKTKQDAQVFIKNYKAGNSNVHSHEQNNHVCGVHNNGNSMAMHSSQYPTSMYPNMMYPPQMPGQMYPNMMYPQQFPNQPYNPNMMMGYGMQNNMPHSGINQQCECGYIYNNEYEDEGEMDEEEDLLDFEADSPELIKPPEISEMNKTLDGQKTESEKLKINEPTEQISAANIVEEQSSVVDAVPVVVKEPTIMMSDLTNFSIENDNKPNKLDDKLSTQEQNDNVNLSKKELKKLKKQQKKELKLIKKQEKRNKHIYDEMEDYDF